MSHRNIYIVRHAQYNPHDPDPDLYEAGISDLGVEQAQLTAERLAHLPIGAIHSSSLRRATQTAAPLKAQFPTARYEETDILWETIPFADESIPKAITNGIKPAELQADGDRAEAAFKRYFAPADDGMSAQGSHEILVTHANTLRYFVARALGATPSIWLRMRSYNCGMTHIMVSKKGRFLLVAYNDTGHLMPEMVTDNFRELQ